jgi:hypothetical protein
VPGAASRFANELRTATDVARRGTVLDVACASAPTGPTDLPHRLEVTGDEGDHLVPLDHDETAERVVVAVGGTPPPCLQLVDLLPEVTGPRLWTAILAQHGRKSPPPPDDLLTRLPSQTLRRILANRLAREFEHAGPAVQESVAKLGLALLAPTFELTPADVAKYELTRAFPRWDVGTRAWTDRELVQLDRWFRAAPGDRLPHLAHLPTDPLARRAVARYASDTLDDHHLYTRAELAAALAPVFHNVARLVRLLLDERLLEESNGCFRTAHPGVAAERRRGRRARSA